MAKSKQLTPKKIGNSDMIGARGVNLIERRILEMGTFGTQVKVLRQVLMVGLRFAIRTPR